MTPERWQRLVDRIAAMIEAERDTLEIAGMPEGATEYARGRVAALRELAAVMADKPRKDIIPVTY